MAVLRLLLGDQLYRGISSLQDCDKKADVILMCEVQEEAKYVPHHKKKIAFLFSAMRHFCQELEQAGYKVQYTQLDDPDNRGSFRTEVERAMNEHQISSMVVTHPGEYRLLEEFKSWQNELAIPLEIREDDRFLCSTEEFARWAKGRSQLRMEYFYREMRKKYALLMEGDKPVGGQWNFDSENRKAPEATLKVPAPFNAEPDDITSQVLDLVADRFADHFGDLQPFYFAVTRARALDALDLFIEQRLGNFGDYQDAMLEGQPWMFHAHLSFYLNCGLLQPLECARAAERAYYEGHAPLNAVEGFIRQIIGWREYVRGIYWLTMPDYAERNYLAANHPLPAFYWTAETQMNCIRQCVLETKANAYAHHIQRLMVLGNFALLAGIAPAQINEWYLLVYADAYEWVELPNVTGMILFADGGMLASKPYAAGGAYINRMSNYCQSCSYSVTKKNGPKACPFNYLYWDFLARNRDKLNNNARLGMMYRSYDRMAENKQNAISEDARRFLKALS